MTLDMIPADVMYLILGLLSPVDHLALAVTSKPLLANLGVDVAQTLDTEGKRQFLQLLERDDPTKAICFGCNRLAKLDEGPVTGWLNRSHYLCEGKVERARYRNASFASMVESPDSGTEITKYATNSWMASYDGPEIPFADVYLVMNRHFYGQPYGLPIEHLERSYTFEKFIPSYKSSCVAFDHFPLERHASGNIRRLRYKRHKPNEPATSTTKTSSRDPGSACPNTGSEETSAHLLRGLPPLGPLPDEATPWQFSHKYSAKIIDDELYISRSHHIVGPPGFRGDIATVVSNIRLPFCMHLVGDPMHSYGTGTVMPDSPLGNSEQYFLYPPKYEPVKPVPIKLKLDTGKTITRLTRPCRRDPKWNGWSDTEASKRRSCKFCYTDYDVLFSMRDDCFHMEVKTYHRLGACRSPDDPVWTCLSTRNDEIWPSIHQYPCEIDSPGKARAQWYKDGTIDDSANWYLWRMGTFEELYRYKLPAYYIMSNGMLDEERRLTF